VAYFYFLSRQLAKPAITRFDCWSLSAIATFQQLPDGSGPFLTLPGVRWPFYKLERSLVEE